MLKKKDSDIQQIEVIAKSKEEDQINKKNMHEENNTVSSALNDCQQKSKRVIKTMKENKLHLNFDHNHEVMDKFEQKF